MRILLADPNSGEVGVHEVPAPELRPGGILVRTSFSAISAGTERYQLETASKTIVGKAISRPDLVRQVLSYARSNGVGAAYRKVRSRLDTLTPLGYSCSGIVIGVGGEVTGFSCGDRVACAGAEYASHAEINCVPQNLAVHVPGNVSMETAALSTLGAIALQGLRQAEVALGETVVVIGAGLVGVLAIQLARSAGCRVVAVDLDPERAQRAVSLGAHLGLVTSDPRLEETIRVFSRYGADAVLITADTRSSEPIELAARLLRDRGRIVIVGTVGMDVARASLYAKEISVVMSRSYGPGRYDPHYEEDGHDYPVGYVRWTEKRNLEAFLDLVSAGSIDLSHLLERRCDIGEAGKAMQDLGSGKYYTSILTYPPVDTGVSSFAPGLFATPPRAGSVQIGCIGAGIFACEHIFPNLAGFADMSLDSVASASGVAAKLARGKYGFARACTPSELLENPAINAVFVLSRNSTHAMYVVRALQNGKRVFVEKPLAVNRDQLDEIRLAHEAARNPFVMVGFNRRFAPATERLQEFFAGRVEPMAINIRINAGFLPQDHWTQHSKEGGRIVGELCHFVDWARFLVGRSIQTISAVAMPDCSRYNSDNVAVTLSFSDGSVANLLYLANGDKIVPKEEYEVFCQGKVALLNDFRALELIRDGKRRTMKFAHDKGHKAELRQVMECLKSGRNSPIPFSEVMEVSQATFRIEELVRCPATESAQERALASRA